MRTIFVVVSLIGASFILTGCFTEKNGLRQNPAIWERHWGPDMPDSDSQYRTHGGVI
jgi:hypothetical protein